MKNGRASRWLRRSLLTLVLSTHATCAWATPPPLSTDQQRRLEAGEIVLLDTLPPGASASAQGATAVAFVCAPPAVVWGILVDWGNHPTIYPNIKRSEVTQADSSRVRLRYTLGVGPLSYDAYVDVYPDAARRHLEWRLAEDRPSRFLAENSGYWQVDDARGESLVTYAVASRTIVPGFLTRAPHRESLVSTVEAVRKQAGQDSPSACPHFAR